MKKRKIILDIYEGVETPVLVAILENLFSRDEFPYYTSFTTNGGEEYFVATFHNKCSTRLYIAPHARQQPTEQPQQGD
jgi:hypothetical protein